MATIKELQDKRRIALKHQVFLITEARLRGDEALADSLRADKVRLSTNLVREMMDSDEFQAALDTLEAATKGLEREKLRDKSAADFSTDVQGWQKAFAAVLDIAKPKAAAAPAAAAAPPAAESG